MNYAHLDENNVVDNVILVDSADFISQAFPDEVDRWVEIVDDDPELGVVGQIGATYISDLNIFTMPSPFPSWVKNEYHRWDPPSPYPHNSDGVVYFWSEEQLQWVAYDN